MGVGGYSAAPRLPSFVSATFRPTKTEGSIPGGRSQKFFYENFSMIGSADHGRGGAAESMSGEVIYVSLLLLGGAGGLSVVSRSLLICFGGPSFASAVQN